MAIGNAGVRPVFTDTEKIFVMCYNDTAFSLGKGELLFIAGADETRIAR